MTRKGFKGARCDQAGKAETLNILNQMVELKLQDASNPKQTIDVEYTKQNMRKIVQLQLCSEQEFLFRYYDEMSVNNKVWFLDPDYAAIIQIENINKIIEK